MHVCGRHCTRTRTVHKVEGKEPSCRRGSHLVCSHFGAPGGSRSSLGRESLLASRGQRSTCTQYAIRNLIHCGGTSSSSSRCHCQDACFGVFVFTLSFVVPSDITLTRPLSSCPSFEPYYDPVPVHHWMTDNPMFPIGTCVLYAALIFGGQHLMRNSESWKWRNAMSAWNLFLSVFSTIGMLRTAPQLLHNLTSMSLRDNLCLDPRSTYGSGSTGLWVQAFILSKFP